MSSALASLSGIAVRGRSLVLAALCALTLPMFAVKAWTSSYADALGARIAGWLIAVAPTLPAQPEADELGELAESEPPFITASSVRGAAVDAKRPHQAAHSRAVPVHGIRISAARVLALAARRALPQAVFVKANAEHPAGLSLGGVSALGVGLQDGDILTEAAGQKISSVPQVVGLVLAARSRQASEISGRFYRAGVPFLLVVEQPYPKQPLPG